MLDRSSILRGEDKVVVVVVVFFFFWGGGFFYDFNVSISEIHKKQREKMWSSAVRLG